MKRIVLLSIIALLLLSVGGMAQARYTMSWGFELIGNPNARQVALNIANAQQELLRTTEDQTGIERFKESLNRMAMSKAVRDIVHYNPDSDDPDRGFVPVDDGWIYYEWDEVAETMRIYYYSDGGWTEITIDSSNPPEVPTM
ncbi:MAG: hypothetical protein GX979_05055 [Firmicutes bacterium]|nr:hypothetical protein [Bacillota bacterium]